MTLVAARVVLLRIDICRPRPGCSKRQILIDNNNNLFQRLSVLIQRYNAILLHDCFVKEEEEKGSFQLDFCTFFVLHSVIFSFPGN